MKISTKVTLAVLTAITSVQVVAAVLRYADERELLLEETRLDSLFVARVLDRMFAHVPDDRVAQEIDDVVASIGTGAVHVQVRRISVAPNAPAADRPYLDPSEWLTRTSHDPIVALTEGEAVSYIPFGPRGDQYLELIERLDTVQTFLDRSFNRSVVNGVALVSLGALFTMLVVTWLVRRPMEQLIVGVRRLAQGDLTARVPIDRQDEIGAFARDMNAMAAKLEFAQKRLEEETAARMVTVEALRHADRLRTVGQVASSIAHELGTPLNVVLGRARMIEQTEQVPDEVRENAGIVAEQASRMAKLIRQLLGFARTQGPSKRRADLRVLAQEALDMLAPIAKKQGVHCELAPAADPVDVDVDRHQILQAITNLVMNGVQAMPDGGKLVVRTELTRCDPPTWTMKRPGEFARLSVADEGVGIAANHREHLFEPFFTTKSEGEGTGLGLPVTFGIVRDHGGWIDVASELGRGSTFSVFLPPHGATS